MTESVAKPGAVLPRSMLEMVSNDLSIASANAACVMPCCCRTAFKDKRRNDNSRPGFTWEEFMHLKSVSEARVREYEFSQDDPTGKNQKTYQDRLHLLGRNVGTSSKMIDAYYSKIRPTDEIAQLIPDWSKKRLLQYKSR